MCFVAVFGRICSSGHGCTFVKKEELLLLYGDRQIAGVDVGSFEFGQRNGYGNFFGDIFSDSFLVRFVGPRR